MLARRGSPGQHREASKCGEAACNCLPHGADAEFRSVPITIPVLYREYETLLRADRLILGDLGCPR
jgi:hypothetical protein